LQQALHGNRALQITRDLDPGASLSGGEIKLKTGNNLVDQAIGFKSG
jgi:hypothetical protein